MFRKQRWYTNLFTMFWAVWLGTCINDQAKGFYPDSRRPIKERGIQQSRLIEIPITAKEAYVTETVPEYESGRFIQDYKSLYKTKKIPVINGKLSVKLSSIPVFIETAARSHVKDVTHTLDSPFAIAYGGFLRDADYSLSIMKDLGVSWVRFLGPWGGLVWDLVEPEKKSYSWSSTDNLYSMAAHKYGLNIMVNIYPINSWDHPSIKPATDVRVRRLPAKYPNDIDSYLAFIRASVERYDGDGEQDAPGFPKIKQWIIGCEMESYKLRWSDTPENYAKLFIETYRAIKESDPEATVLMFGANIEKSRKKGRIQEFILPVLQEIKKQTVGCPRLSFVFSIHHYSHSPAKLKDNIVYTRNLLDSTGFINTPIWVTDSATFTTDNPQKKKFRSEKVLAQDVIKLYCTGLANGIEKYVWAQLSDGYVGKHGIESGLVGKLGATKGSTRKRQQSAARTYKKLAYYTYKLMVDKLDGSDWKTVMKLHEGENGVYLYGFKDKYENTTYVAWADNGDVRQQY